MAWTYDPAQLVSNRMMQIRYLIGDTLAKDPQVQDEELSWALGQHTSIYGAASEACRSLAARLSREADTSQGPLRTAYSTRARAYLVMCGHFAQQAMVRSAALPYGGQMSQADHDRMLADPDRLGPQFSLGMTDTDGTTTLQQRGES